MQKMRLLRAKTVDFLTKEIESNLGRYRSGDFDFLTNDPANYFEIDTNFEPDALKDVYCVDGDLREVDCCEAIYTVLGHVPPYVARDPRLWVYMSHVHLLHYTRSRWPIPEDDVEALVHVKKHFFAEGTRGIERDNAASRLWWMAALCDRVEELDLKSALTAFLHQSDVRANIIERPTTSQTVPVFSAVIQKLHESYLGDKSLFERDRFRAVMKSLNLKGGTKLLEVMEASDVKSIVDSCAK
ncbi:DUF6339 family protein [Rhodoferax sp. BAB1]|uniref:DUF6339 family protein n=1 Tax=Rhodoferax sp. BAB1 TaxID=2741720 RepID=UPI0015765077|nr:DUF6339 family protein [Rhodoferax sp. BAB1]QKO21974.1 hypothetical protein HTY51_08765 [Rhodoferax sp. BAB1]